MKDTEAYDTATALIQQLNKLAAQEAAKRFSGTDALYGDVTLEFNLWLAEKMKDHHLLTVTKLTPELLHLAHKLHDIGIVIDRVTGAYLLRGETNIRRTTFTDINQLVFTLWMIHDTPLRYIHLHQGLVL